MKKRNTFFVIIMIFCLMFCTACGSIDSNDEKIIPAPTGSGQDNSEENELTKEEGLSGKEYEKGVFLMTKSNVKLLGRTWLNDDVRWLSYSAAGVEFNFSGKKCEFSLMADSKVNETSHQARYAIYVDDELFCKDLMDVGIKTVTVVDSETVTEHVIRLVKLSETSDSSMGIRYITCDEEATISPTSENELKIEFVGDSITCGYGVDGTLEDTYSTHNEDATKAYAYLTAKKLGADYSLVSQSGYGIVSGYTAGEKNEAQTLPQYYDKVGHSYGMAGSVKPSDIVWDFSFKPDVVVINLGTNDYSYTGSDFGKCEEYIQGYYDFLGTVREKNPDAVIVCALGIMGQELCPNVETVVERFVSDTGDDSVYYVKLDNQAYSNGYAVDYHPTEASHEHAAEQMSEAITQILAGTYTPAE